jgi:hypothetical protein
VTIAPTGIRDAYRLLHPCIMPSKGVALAKAMRRESKLPSVLQAQGVMGRRVARAIPQRRLGRMVARFAEQIFVRGNKNTEELSINQPILLDSGS